MDGGPQPVVLGRRRELEENTANRYRDDLTHRALPFFKEHHLSQITVPTLDRPIRTRPDRATAAKFRTSSTKKVSICRTNLLDQAGRNPGLFPEK